MNITWHLPKKYIFIFFITLTNVFNVKGQITLTASSVSTSPNTSFFVDIIANTKDSIAGLQFSMSWDSTTIKYQSTENFGLPELKSDDLNVTKNNTGQIALAFVWVSPTGEGVKLKENQVIFRLKFLTIGQNGSKSLVQFTSSPRSIRAYDFNVKPLEVQTKDGLVNIGTAAIGEAYDTEGVLTLYQNTPNPAKEFTIIPFKIIEPDTILFQVFDIQGREVFNKKEKYAAGKHEIKLSTDGVFKNGTYIYSIIGSRSKVSRTMVINN
jgi:Secretion system C-terminal sorting domain